MTGPAAGPGARPRALALCFVLALVACAWFVRTRGLECMLPQRPMGDEEVFVHHLQILRGELDVPHSDYRQGIYPRLVPLLASLAPRGAPPAAPLEAASAEHVLLRRVVALLSLLAVPATWWIARRFLDPFGAGIATALCAFSALFAWFAPQARPHAAQAGLCALALVACLRLAERGSLARYLAAGTGCGLALAALHNGIVLLAPLAAAHFLRARSRGWRESWKLALALVPVALGLRLGYPYLFWSRAEQGPGLFGLVKPGAELIDTQGAERLLAGLWDFEPWLLVVGAAAIACWLLRRARRAAPAANPALLVLLAWALPYVLLFGLYQHSTQRYNLPLVPLLSVLAAWIACALGCAPALALVALQACGAWRLGELRTRPDTLAQAAQWVEHEIAPRSQLWILPSLVLPLRCDPARLAGGVPDWVPLWIEWQARHPPAPGEPWWKLEPLPISAPGALQRLRADPAAFVDELGAGLVMVEVYDRPFARELMAGLRARGELVARFAPGGAQQPGEKPYLPRDAHGEYERDFCWLARAFAVERFGSVIEVYRLGAKR